MSDGFRKYFNKFWHGTYYRHNTLLLVNSCHSGAVNGQQITDSFGLLRLDILLAAFGLSKPILKMFEANASKQNNQSCLIGFQIPGGMSIKNLASYFNITPEKLILIAKAASDCSHCGHNYGICDLQSN